MNTNVLASQRTPIAFGIFAQTITTMASARQIRDEIMKMTIVVNSDPAQKAIYDLGQKTNDLVANKRKLSKELKETETLLGKESEEYKALAKEILATSKEITGNRKEMERLRSDMDVTQMTMTQLKQEAKLLRASLDNMVPGSDTSKAMQAQLDKVNARMAEVRAGAGSTSLSFKNLAERFNHYSGIVAAGTAVLVGFGLTVQNIIDRNNKLVEAQTAVSKTVGMTKQEVEDLTKSFSDLDTRTSKIDLLKIAETGGRLGVGKAEIKDFVQEVDKANVALGDGFAGGVEAVTDTLGKLKGLYSQTKDLNIATAINQIGSAMNELGAAGAASEQNIGEFAMRLGSLPEKLKPTIAEALALGAAFEESGIDAERASTAYSSVIRTAAKDADKFAKVMNISKKEVEDLMNKDPLEFFLKFSEGAKGLDTTELAKMLDYLKLNDQYVISTMGAASENTDRFRKSIELSNKSLTEATSLQQEFDKVNNNSAAIFEKVQKHLVGIFANDSVAKGLNWLIEGFGKMIGAVEDTDGTLKTTGQTIVFLTKLFVIGAVAIFSYNTAVALTNITLQGTKDKLIGYTVIQKAHNLYTQTSTFLQNLVTAAYLRGQVAILGLTGNTVRQAAAQRMLNTITLANPFALVVTAIMALGAAYLLLSKRIDETAQKQKVLNDVRTSAAMAVQDEKSKLESLLIVARNESASKADRLAAIKKLNEISPEYLGNLTLENLKTAEGTRLINEYIKSLDRKAMSEALSSKRTELFKKQIELQGKDVEPGWQNLGGVGTYVEQKLNSGNKLRNMSVEDAKNIDAMTKVADIEKELSKYVPLVQQAYRKRREELKANFQQMSSLNSEQKKFLQQNPGAVLDPKSNYTIPGDDTGKGKSSSDASARKKERENRLKEEHDREMSQIAKNGEEAARLANQIALDITGAKIDAMQEGLEKELAQINIDEMRKSEAIEKQKIGATDINNLQKKIDKATGQDKKLYQALMDAWIKNNEQLEQEKLAQSEIFDQKRRTAEYKAETKRLSDIDKAHQTELGHLKRQQDEELASYTTLAQLKEGLKGRIDEKERQKITTWAEGKEALTKVYQKRELELQVTHLEAMVKLYEGLDLGVLTPEQREQVMKFIDEAGNKIAEFKAKIAGTDQTDTKKAKDKNDSSDIFGMTAGGWRNLVDDIKDGSATAADLVKASVGAMQSAFSTYFAYVEANEKRQLQRFEQRTAQKKLTYKKQLLEGYINQETYKKLSLKADQDLDKKKAELEIKAAKRERAQQVMSIIGNTANAIMGIWAQFPKFDFGATAAIMSGVVGALGAVQLATVLATPLPTADGYEDGFGMEYPIERAQDGKRFNVRRKRLSTGLVDRPTHFIAGENNKVEMVIDSPTWTKYPDELKQAIYSANARAKGFENGYNTIGDIGKKTESNDDVMIMLISTVNRMNTTLDNIEKNGIQAKIAKTARNGKEVEDMRSMYNDLNNKNKHG